MTPKQVLLLFVRVDLVVMAMKLVLHAPQNSRTGALPFDPVSCYNQNTPGGGGSYPSTDDAVSVFSAQLIELYHFG